MNAWSGVTLDAKRAMVFVATGSASYDFYGANRIGDDLYANSVIALDARTGSVRWDVKMADYKTGYSSTGAPLAVKDKIITGMAGGEFGVRGFIDAYDAKTGKRVWRFNTIPAKGEPGNETWAGESWKTGSATTWVTGAYDPETNTVYWGTGNPGPDWNGDVRKGDNLYSDCVIALDPDTGAKKWHFQYTPHDVNDWDSTQTPILAEAIPAEQVALAGGRVWMSNPLDAFSHRNQRLYLDWLAGTAAGEAALQHAARVVLVIRGDAPAKRMQKAPAFRQVAHDAHSILYVRRR